MTLSQRPTDELRTRARQQAAVAELGQRALADTEIEELLDEATEVLARELGVEFVSLLELEPGGDALRLRGGHGWPEGTVGKRLPADANTIQGYALRAREPVLSEDLDAETRFAASEVQRANGVVSAMAAPIGGRTRPFGVIGVHSRAPHHFSEDDSHFLVAVANVVAAAVERHRADALFRELADTTPALMWTTDDQGHITFANEAWLRFTGMTLDEQLGDTFAMSAHPEDRPALQLAWRRALAARAPFREEYRLRRHDGEYRWVLEEALPRFSNKRFTGYAGTATEIHDRREAEDALRESERRFRDMADTAPVMIWTTDGDGHVTFVNQRWLEYTGTTLERELGATFGLGVHDDDVQDVLASWERALGERAPWEREYRLRGRDGDYRWIVDRGLPRFSRAGRFIGYVGTAVDIHERREVFEREHAIAETLQRSLLPERLPEIEGLELAARYLPAAAGTAVGGDWYDAVELPDGRVGVVVGDVVGHGLRAAATMGQLRNAFRAYAAAGDEPARVVAAVDRLAGVGGDNVMATVAYLAFDRDSGEVVYTCAGHPPPLALEPDGPRFLEEARSIPLGAADAATFRQAKAQLAPGSTLLLYTDGLIERREEALAEGLARLASAADELPDGASLDELCDRVLAAALEGAQPADDVALLAVRPRVVGCRPLSLDLAADPEVLGPLRRRLGRFLDAAGANAEERYEITLAVSEAAVNAIEHAYGPGDARFATELALEDRTIVAAIRDSGRWRERRATGRGRGLRLIDGLMDDCDVSSGETGTTVRMRRRLTE